MVAEKRYLSEKLKEAGIKSQIYTSMKKLKLANDIHLGAVLRKKEKFTRSNSKKLFVEDGVRKRRYRLFDRKTTISVVIADSDEEKCEEIFYRFLQLVGKGFEHDGDWIHLTVGDADWVEEGDSILKSKIAVEMEVTFEGSIYEDVVQKKVGIGTIK